MVEKDGSDRKSKDEGACASLRVKKLENRISPHPRRNYQIVLVAGKQKCSPLLPASIIFS